MLNMTHWTSERVSAGTPAYNAAKADAATIARQNPGTRAEWRDEYNDYSVRGVWAVVS
jgi:hypothetical protein